MLGEKRTAEESRAVEAAARRGGSMLSLSNPNLSDDDRARIAQTLAASRWPASLLP
jgi:hypothetical protein